jgi:hypothetical protein
MPKMCVKNKLVRCMENTHTWLDSNDHAFFQRRYPIKVRRLMQI